MNPVLDIFRKVQQVIHPPKRMLNAIQPYFWILLAQVLGVCVSIEHAQTPAARSDPSHSYLLERQYKCQQTLLGVSLPRDPLANCLSSTKIAINWGIYRYTPVSHPAIILLMNACSSHVFQPYFWNTSWKLLSVWNEQMLHSDVLNSDMF